MSTIAKIEVARAHIEFHLLQEDMKRNEEACAREIQELASAPSGIELMMLLPLAKRCFKLKS